jgi:TonB family protein
VSTYDTPPVLLAQNSDLTIRQEIVPLAGKAQEPARPGVVVLSVTVDSHGKPTRVRVDDGVGMEMDDKAVAVVKQDHFRPALRVGKPVEATVSIRVTFTPGAN